MLSFWIFVFNCFSLFFGEAIDNAINQMLYFEEFWMIEFIGGLWERRFYIAKKRSIEFLHISYISFIAKVHKVSALMIDYLLQDCPQKDGIVSEKLLLSYELIIFYESLLLLVYIYKVIVRQRWLSLRCKSTAGGRPALSELHMWWI